MLHASSFRRLVPRRFVHGCAPRALRVTVAFNVGRRTSPRPQASSSFATASTAPARPQGPPHGAGQGVESLQADRAALRAALRPGGGPGAPPTSPSSTPRRHRLPLTEELQNAPRLGGLDVPLDEPGAFADPLRHVVDVSGIETPVPRDPSVATGRLMSRDWRYHSAWPPPADVEGAAEAAAGVRVPSPVAYASPRGLLPLEPLVAACRAVGGLAWDAVVAARAAVGLGPRSAPVSGGAGCGNPEVDPAAAAAAASSASPGHGRMDVRGEKQAGPLPGAGSHPKAECDSHAQTVTPRGAGLKPSPPAPPAKAGAGARRGLHTPAGGAGGGRRGGSVGGAALPEPESVGGMIGAAEALLAERDADERSARHTLSGGVGARTRNGDVGAAVAAAATVADADVPLVGPTAADEDYARLGTKSAPRDARLGDVHVLPGAGGRPAVLARSDGIEEGMLEARVAHIHLAFRDEDALAGAHEVKAPGKGGGGKGLRHARRRGRGPVTVVDDAAALDAAVGLGLAPEDAADRWDLEPTQPEAAALAHDPWTADETTAASTDRAKAGTALWQQQQQRAASTTTTGASGAGGEPLPAPPRDWEEDALPPGAPVSSAAGWGVPPEYDPDAVDAPARVAGRAAASAAATYAAGAMRGSGSGATAMSDERHIDYVETGGGVARPEASASGYADLERPGEDTEAAASYTGTTVRPGADRPSVPQQPR